MSDKLTAKQQRVAEQKMAKRMRGTMCKHECQIHGEKCNVIVKYKDKRIQATVDMIAAIQGAPPHSADSKHYCAVCAVAIRDNRPVDAYHKNADGVITLKNFGKNRLKEVGGELLDTTFEEE